MNKLKYLIRKSLEIDSREGFKEELKAKLIGETQRNGLLSRLIYPISFAMIAVIAVSAVYFSKPEEGLFEKVYAENMAFYDEVEQKLANGYIVYEKVLHKSFNPRGGEYSNILETWSDGQGNSLSIPRDPVTEEILGGEFAGASMVLREGDINHFYTTDPNGFGLPAGPVQERYECVVKDKFTESGKNFKATIFFDESDIKNENLPGLGFSYSSDETEPEYQAAREKRALLFGLRSPFIGQEGSAVFEELEQNGTSYEKVTENGRDYYVFNLNFERKILRGVKVVEDYYLDAESYRLVKIHSRFFNENGEAANENTKIFLEMSYLPAEESKDIFNPEKYDLHMHPDIAPIGIKTEEGCYYPDGERMTDAEKEKFWDSLPEHIKTLYQKQIEEIKSY